MGRCIYENGNFVWKYVFGAQSSEQYRIYEQFGIGEYEEDEQDDSLDYLTLTTEDISDLEEILTTGEYQNKKQKFEELAKEYEGLNLYFSDQDNKEIYVNPFEEGKTEQDKNLSWLKIVYGGLLTKRLISISIPYSNLLPLINNPVCITHQTLPGLV